MPSLKDLRNRIASVKATQKITKAMQMVAAAKLRRAQEAAEAARPYSQRMATVLANIAQEVGSGGDAPALMTGSGKDDVHLFVVCTAERGLCGGFNAQIARRLGRDGGKIELRRQFAGRLHGTQGGLDLADEMAVRVHGRVFRRLSARCPPFETRSCGPLLRVR